MKRLIIKGGNLLNGTVKISGAKNSIVALLPASMLTRGKCVIHNVPDISDVHILIDTMRFLGSKIEFNNGTITIDNSNIVNKKIDAEYATKLRASYYFMGSLLGKYHHAEIAYPGGCIIGSRPIDIHLNSFKKLGASIQEKDGHYIMDTDNIIGDDIFFDFPSVGATINVMLTAVLGKGTTKIINAAREPEIKNVADFLISMGANIEGAGSGIITINGVNELHDGEITVIPDRIEAGTYIILGALLGENFTVEGIVEEHLYALLLKLKDAGVIYKIDGNKIHINKCDNLKGVNIKTGVYPGFPTDLGQPMSTFLTQCSGQSVFEETIYENRLRHVPHLNHMGANINSLSSKAIIIGPSKLVGKKVKATDLRAGAAMLVAGMIANGTTTIENIEHILRGYENIVDKLNNVGADITYIDE